MGNVKGIVRAATDPKKWNGKTQIGFTLKGDPDKWYNISGTEDELRKIRKTLISKGNEIEFEFDNEKVSNLKVLSQAKEEKESLDEDIVNFETLLSDAHEKFGDKFSIATEKIDIDVEKKYALFKAVVTIKQDDFVREFQAHGDATSENVKGEYIKPHFIRMAETRAIARALRWTTNNAATAEEEKK